MASVHTASAEHSYPGPLLPSPDHVRLLSLQPGVGNEDIKCGLIVTELDSTQAYEALSYTWGALSDPQVIYVMQPGSTESKAFSVTSNCLSALQRLRYKDRARMIWIDALCIDQSNVSERNHQVTLMSKIYSQATNVVIFLGHATQDSDLAIDFIAECDDPDTDAASLSYPKSETLIKALNKLFRRPWFTRVWVVQEAILSSSAVVYCGEKSLSWSAIKNFKIWNTSTRWLPLLPFVVTFEKQHFAPDTSSAENIMFKALLQARHCGATNPRDKVYALLPLLSSFGKHLTLEPSYEDSLAKIYTDCATILVAEGGLETLYAVQGGSDINDLPSWVPDWSIAPRRRVLGTSGRIEKTSFWAKTKKVHVPHAPQVIPSTSSMQNTQMSLRAAGFLSGTIAKISSACFADQRPFPLQEWKGLLDDETVKSLNRKGEVPMHHGIRGPLDYVFHRVLGAAGFSYADAIEDFLRDDECFEDSEEDDLPHDDALYNNKRKYSSQSWDKMVRQMTAAMNAETGSADAAMPFERIPFHLAGQGQCSSDRAFVRYVLQSCHARRFFVTDKGHIGIAPEEARVDDLIYLLVDTAIPFALRTSQKQIDEQGVKQVQFIGECYMESKVWTDLGKASDELQWVDIA